MLHGFYQYFALHHCDRELSWIRHEVQRQWYTRRNAVVNDSGSAGCI
jgi:hypothetical protein